MTGCVRLFVGDKQKPSLASSGPGNAFKDIQETFKKAIEGRTPGEP